MSILDSGHFGPKEILLQRNFIGGDPSIRHHSSTLMILRAQNGMRIQGKSTDRLSLIFWDRTLPVLVKKRPESDTLS